MSFTDVWIIIPTMIIFIGRLFRTKAVRYVDGSFLLEIKVKNIKLLLKCLLFYNVICFAMSFGFNYGYSFLIVYLLGLMTIILSALKINLLNDAGIFLEERIVFWHEIHSYEWQNDLEFTKLDGEKITFKIKDEKKN